ncbi:MarR family transcriptional regulator [Ktedonobacter racemifer]|uniref:Transcriptional regulator, MarR family n=1 Tax=Ktedonobacter racemifer DSM 44963 TaxID=485913 RepID=D6U8P0_KTERA|nr:MarR family transcriptional regulator [Ktedonobacter racemifer]EFH79600.1 transcriptional regulator, MarR family [Ktedonobacter racemifer DSM 44963]
MTNRQQEILEALRSKRNWTTSTFAKHLGISVAAVSKMFSRLEGQGKIQRIIDPHDRRARVIRVIQE